MANEKITKQRSQIALDCVNFFLSDVETGVGPFMAAYFAAVRHWNPAQIGIILAAQKIFSVGAQALGGWFIDRTTLKKWVMAGVGLAISCGAALVVFAPTVPLQVLNQATVGISTSIATLAIAALSLGLVGRQNLGRRIGRNGAFSHAGNMLTASIAGYIAYRVGLQWIFYVSAVLGLLCTASALSIRSADIDDRVARESPGAGLVAVHLGELIRQRNVLVFGLAVILFHVANSAMLPLADEEISKTGGALTSLYITASIVLPQMVMIPVSLFSGRTADRIGRRPVLLLAFSVLSLRGLLFAFGHTPNYVVAVEALDGIGTGIATVVTVLVVSDLARNTGRFNALGGVMQACLGIGAFFGNLFAGMLAKQFGFPTAFGVLAAVAVAGLLLFFLAMPETLNPSTMRRT